MKKKAISKDVQEATDKSIFRQAGEMIGSIGAHIVNAKDIVVDFVSDEAVLAKNGAKKMVKQVKKATKRTPAKKTTRKPARKTKSGAKKTPLKKSAKKVMKKTPIRKKK